MSISINDLQKSKYYNLYKVNFIFIALIFLHRQQILSGSFITQGQLAAEFIYYLFVNVVKIQIPIELLDFVKQAISQYIGSAFGVLKFSGIFQLIYQIILKFFRLSKLNFNTPTDYIHLFIISLTPLLTALILQ